MSLHSLQCALVAMLQCYPGVKNSQPGVSNYRPGQSNKRQTKHWQTAENALQAKHDLSAAENLSAAEKKWLESIWESEGFQVTSEIQQWWRKARLKIAAPLTLRAIDKYGTQENGGREGKHEQQDLVERYIQEVPCSTLFFVPEALSFCQFIIEQQEHCPPLKAIAEFESAIKKAHEYAESPRQKSAQVEFTSHLKLRRADDSATVLFPSEPGRLLAGLLSATNHTDICASNNNRNFLVLVSPEIAHLWRLACCDEAEVLQRIKPGDTVVAEHLPDFDAAILTLIKDGILDVC